MVNLYKQGLSCTALALALSVLHCNSAAPAPSDSRSTPTSSNSSVGGSSSVTATSATNASTVTTVGGASSTAAVTTTDASTTTTGAGGTTSAEPEGGYYESGAWHGYAWTSPGEVAGTTIAPEEFATHMTGDPYCVAGSVGPDPDYGGVALLGFNVNQAALPDAGQTEAAILDVVPTGTGIAINFSKAIGSTLRVQIQGLAGETDANDRWCYEIADAAGPVFAPYAEFNTECWTGGMGTAYAMQPISAVVFLVPGDNTEAVEYDFCVDGFADGSSVDDAPDSLGGGGQEISGTLTGDDEKVKVVSGGKSYMVFNNNWGPNRGSQSIDYVGNSFTVTQQTGGAGPNSEPASYPSIYIGANGFQGANGALTTSSDDNLPIMASSITSIQTTFSHNASGQDANATYDVWFAASAPTGEYSAAGSGYLMVWLYRPGGDRFPLGGQQGTASLAGRTWDVWVGARGDGTNAQVVSYVAQSTIPSMTFDLNEFIQDAIANSRGGFSASWYLTDIFAGFEIWSGGTGLSVSDFSAVVQ